jgi:hypothetical protein
VALVLGGLAYVALQSGIGQQPFPRPGAALPTTFERPSASVSEVSGIGEPAPTGYVWSYQTDWDGTVARKCLVNASVRGGPIDRQVVDELLARRAPDGYAWTYTTQGNAPAYDRLTWLCLQRSSCPFGRDPGTDRCRARDQPLLPGMP